jgi:hypothetical protein
MTTKSVIYWQSIKVKVCTCRRHLTIKAMLDKEILIWMKIYECGSSLTINVIYWKTRVCYGTLTVKVASHLELLYLLQVCKPHV